MDFYSLSIRNLGVVYELGAGSRRHLLGSGLGPTLRAPRLISTSISQMSGEDFCALVVDLRLVRGLYGLRGALAPSLASRESGHRC